MRRSGNAVWQALLDHLWLSVRNSEGLLALSETFGMAYAYVSKEWRKEFPGTSLVPGILSDASVIRSENEDKPFFSVPDSLLSELVPN